uniref:Uncharacterized protein n=1 Tax=Avena sativa TaxID=4498 RepID=A0ACD5TR64_AVESA
MGDTEWRREEPMSPAARLMDDIDIYVITTFGLDTPINLPVFLSGMDSALAQHPRYSCIQVSDKGLWARTTTVNVEDHIIIPTLDPSAVATDSEKVVEDYVASLSALPMPRSRPLWDFHLLNFPTSEAASTVVFRVHHSIGDGMSLMASLMTTTRLVAAATATSPATPTPVRPPTRRTGAIYEMPRPQLSAGALAFAAWVWSYFVLAWNTAVDLAFVLATIMFLSDPNTMFKRVKNKDESFHRKRFVHRSLSLDDVKCIKNVMNCSVNDVLVGVTSAAMSQYYFRKSGDPNTGEICLRSIIPVSMRPATTLQKYVNVIESDKKDDVIWGNQLGYIILPFHLTKHDDPLAYVRKAKKDLDRKKRSLEVIITNKIAEILMIFLGVKAGALIFRRGFAHTSMVFSNMVGPTEQVELFGHPVAFVAPSVYGIPEALIVHYQSYRRTIKVILSMDDNKFPDYRQLLDDFAKSLMTMKQAASRLSTSTKTD